MKYVQSLLNCQWNLHIFTYARATDPYSKKKELKIDLKNEKLIGSLQTSKIALDNFVVSMKCTSGVWEKLLMPNNYIVI